METRKTKLVLLVVSIYSLLFQTLFSQELELKHLTEMAIEKSWVLKNNELQINRAQKDKQKAYTSYLPKIYGDISYTHLNKEIELPEDMQNLLTQTQKLLIKEQVSQVNPYVNFATPFSSLPSAVQQKVKPIEAVQPQDIFKITGNAQMTLFSGLKVPYTLKAIDAQISALSLMSESEKANVIKSLIEPYYQLAVIQQSQKVLTATKSMLEQQEKFVQKAMQNGLATNLEQQRIKLAYQQLSAKQIELSQSNLLVQTRISQLTGIGLDSLQNIRPQLSLWVVNSSELSPKERQDFKAIEEAINATRYKQKIENTEYIPKIFAFGKREFRKDDLSAFDPQWYVGVGLRWTIFDGTSAHISAQQIKIEQSILKNKQQETEELLQINLIKQQSEYLKQIEMVKVAQEQVATTLDLMAIIEKQYQNGLCSFTDYLTILNSVETSQLEEIKSRYNQYIATAELLNAGGKLNVDRLPNQ